MKYRSSVFCAAALVLAAPSYAQTIQSDMRAQRAEHAQMENDTAIQKQQAGRVRADTMDLKEDRANCRRESGEAHAACEREVRIGRAQKQNDVAMFKQDKAIHQSDSATLQAMHRKTRADKRALHGY